MRLMAIAIVVLAMGSMDTAPAEAGIGSLISKVARSASSRVRQLFSKPVSKGGHAAKAEARHIASSAARGGTHSLARHLGDDGVRLASKLTPVATTRLTTLAPAIAQSPYKREWLELLGQYGGRCVDWLWDHKLGLAVATTASAAMACPDDFLAEIGDVAEATVETAGKHLIEPAIDRGAEVVRESAKQRIAHGQTDPWSWLYPYLTCVAIVAWFWWKWRK